MSLEFLSAAADGRRRTQADGAPGARRRRALRGPRRLERAVGYDGEREALSATVGWADRSHLRKLELSGEPPLPLDLGSAPDGGRLVAADDPRARCS